MQVATDAMVKQPQPGDPSYELFDKVQHVTVVIPRHLPTLVSLLMWVESEWVETEWVVSEWVELVRLWFRVLHTIFRSKAGSITRHHLKMLLPTIS